MIVTESQILKFEDFYRRNFINSLTGFKSVSLISTISKEKVTNLSPFSQIIHVGANPPLLGILFRPWVVPRHTLQNIVETKYFTVNHIKKNFVKEAHWTSARWEDSEFEKVQLKEEYLEEFPAPFVKKSDIKIGCKFEEKHDVKLNGTHFIIASIKLVSLPDPVLKKDGFLDLEEAGTLTLSGLDSYHSTNLVSRFSYAKPGTEPKKI
jgi:flavin reductase (DIM6/NTAB) family NADH-FMN oxidoreductase RutF